MREFQVRVIVKLKDEVLDPQGIALEKAMKDLGLEEVREVRVGKFISFKMRGENEEKLVRRVKETASELLANPIIEDIEVFVDSKK